MAHSYEMRATFRKPSARSYNKRVSGYGASHLRPNPSLRSELQILAGRCATFFWPVKMQRRLN